MWSRMFRRVPEALYVIDSLRSVQSGNSTIWSQQIYYSKIPRIFLCLDLCILRSYERFLELRDLPKQKVLSSFIRAFDF